MISPADAVAFYLGSMPVKFYSLAMFSAISIGVIAICLVAKKYYNNISLERIFDILPIVLISAIVGARLYYVSLDWGYFSKHLSEIFAIWNGGISIHGAILGGFLGGLFCVKKYKLNLWAYADVFSYGVILGQAIGRIGNYFNIEAFGKPCFYSEMLCMYVPMAKRPAQFMMYETFHPTFLYEIIWNLLVFLILLFVVRKVVKNYSGIVFFSYLFLYSIGRFLIEALRLDSIAEISGMHVAQAVSLVLMVISVVMIFYLKKTQAVKEE